jgi:plastocyanin
VRLAAALLLSVLLPAPVATMHVVRMGGGNRFIPAEIHAAPGDTLRFVNARGGIHNVQFEVDSIPEAARVLLAQAMPGDKIAALSGPLLANDDETYDIVVPALPPGRYPFLCLPHQTAPMRGVLIVAAER